MLPQHEGGKEGGGLNPTFKVHLLEEMAVVLAEEAKVQTLGAARSVLRLVFRAEAGIEPCQAHLLCITMPLLELWQSSLVSSTLWS